MRKRRHTGPLSLSVEDYVAGVRNGERAILARAITLIESDHPDHQEHAREVLGELLPSTGGAKRVGVSGVPGVGKSTFIDALGSMLVDGGLRVAVLAVDPSSTVSGGSILADKTRMPRLVSSGDPAFVRPSPSGGTLGGVARKTQETILLCEAAGYDVVLVETVGVGQSETMVDDMVDLFVVLMLAGAGDELQGIKRGILEVADFLAVTKADGDNKKAAARAQKQYQIALTLMRGHEAPDVVAVSAREGTGLDTLWERIAERWSRDKRTGAIDAKRRRQQVKFMWRVVENRLLSDFRSHPGVRARLNDLEVAVRQGDVAATAAAHELLTLFRPGAPSERPDQNA